MQCSYIYFKISVYYSVYDNKFDWKIPRAIYLTKLTQQ